jgi:hypothetical protein
MKLPATGALLNRTDEIRAVLRELMHPDSRVRVRAARDAHDDSFCEARILGPDWQLRHFFWRPHDLDAFQAQLSGSPAHHEVILDFAGATPDGTDIRFRVARPLVMHFADSSAAMLSSFPEAIWYQRTPEPADI